MGDPINKPVNEEGIYYVDLTENTQTGYIDLSATSKYVYALYSDKKMYENNRKSDTVLVFDWDGNPIKKYSFWKKTSFAMYFTWYFTGIDAAYRKYGGN